jgi:DNA-binding response OmpR family regulator
MLRVKPDSVRPTVLVVDDEESMRELVGLHLRNAGYEVVLAEDAIAAARRILKEPPDLLIVDVNLPYWSGPDFVATLRADSTLPRIPVLFITADETFVDQADAMCAACFVKPILKDRLLRAVSWQLRTDIGSAPAGAARAGSPAHVHL